MVSLNSSAAVLSVLKRYITSLEASLSPVNSIDGDPPSGEASTTSTLASLKTK